MADAAEQQNILYQRLTQSVQTAPGSTTPTLRKALTEYVKQASIANEDCIGSESDFPSDLQAYITKVRKYAYKVTDEDIEQLRQAGYNEEAIFEITLSIALGAGTKCLMQGIAAIEGASDAITNHSSNSQG
ncbi:hypothetical protein [Ktedonobacter robiniae]|uniref:Uncharacterized protein n=1 Tax=Ktedonobacter robiniae TaxID=2778365 RepID=A0ABQ3V5I0_9CHLR|nr:hypothetical protein [Ktedonobacter robiniae]GHO60017.1 hypothetical protein KSB_84920 [Ktedonobacter robiniae]